MTKKLLIPLTLLIAYLLGFVTPGFLTVLLVTNPVALATPTIQVISYTKIPTIAPTPTPIAIYPAPTPPEVVTVDEKMFYTVKSGETLSEISIKLGVPIDYLARLNNITDPNKIDEGQVLLTNNKEEILKIAYSGNGKKIIIIISEQKVYAVENGQAVKVFIVSTGIPAYPTRLGPYKIWVKLEKTRMTGPGYDISNVPWVMYFDQGRGFHGADWHNNFGQPMSHGCINMRILEAKWLYEWAEVGTEVLVIP